MIILSPEYFVHLFEYVKWADLRQLETVRPLSDNTYFHNWGWSFGNIHRVILHEISAQSGWLDRFQGRKSIWLLDDPQFALRDAVEPKMKQIHAELGQFIAAQTRESLAIDVTYATMKGDVLTVPRWQLLIHECNHAMHHRGQLNSMITLAGGQPVLVDYAFYVTTFGGLIRS